MEELKVERFVRNEVILHQRYSMAVFSPVSRERHHGAQNKGHTTN